MLPRLPPDRHAQIKLLEVYKDGVMSFPAFAQYTSDTGRLLLEVDLNCPIEGLLPLIQEELREAEALYREGKRKRHRIDKIDFQISVYDTAEEGKSFPEIARALRKRVTTVKSAYLVARRNIFGSDASRPRKSLEDFDAHSHCASCPQCRKAQGVEQMCAKALQYAGRDYKSQRERPIGNGVL